MNINLAFAQTNPVVGDFRSNAFEIRHIMDQAADSGVDLLVFGELALSGYPLGDFSYRPDLIRQSDTALDSIVEHSKNSPGLTIVLGHISLALTDKPSTQKSYAIAHNSASAIANGRVLTTYHKMDLPNYDVFDDWRNFIPGTQEAIFEVSGHKVAIAICEDIWTQSDRGRNLQQEGVELIVVPNGSPFEHDKALQRRSAAKNFSQGTPIAYVNLAGGQDELVFDGGSFLLDQAGREIFCATDEVGLHLVGSDSQRKPSEQEALWRVLCTGLRDYLRKTGQQKVVLGLSGGIDSALCAALAVDAIGSENVLGVALPSRYSSDHSISDARRLAENLGIEFRIVEIDEAHRAFESLVDSSGLAGENLQARIRAVLLMAISNREGHLLLTTGNKSEIAVGYSTIYGDSAGGFAPIKDIFKTDVWRLARHCNERAGRELIPTSSIEKPPSAELRPGQLDQDSLPDYQILDRILRLLIEEGKTLSEIVSAGEDEKTVFEIDSLVRKAEWKRSQTAIGTKVSKVAFGRGRRVPLTTRFKNL
jgi:NAD+ synthase (glutamine-hydrolysing)